MARFVKGDIVVLPFPFSDLTSSKRRPALVLATLPGSDVILCQVTSKTTKDIFSVPLKNDDFSEGSLKTESHIRPNRLFTADEIIILYKAGSITTGKLKEVRDTIVRLLDK